MSSKKKEQIRPSTTSDQNNQFLDDFLKPPQPSQPLIQRRDKTPISIQKKKKKKEKKRGELEIAQQSQLNKQIKNILQSIKREQTIRRQRTRQYLQKLAQEKDFEKKKHQFQIAEKRIKKRMMLIHRKQQLNQQLLCLASSSPNHMILKEKSKSLDDFVGVTPLNNLNSYSNQDLLKSDKNLIFNKRDKIKTDILIVASSSNIAEEKTKQKQFLLPELNKRKAIMMKNKDRQKRIPTITFTRQLTVEMEDEASNGKKKYKNYLSEVSTQLKKRNYTNPHSQLSRIYNEGSHSKQKTQKAIQLIKKIDNKHRTRLKNYEQQDYAQAQRKIQLLDFLFKGPS